MRLLEKIHSEVYCIAEMSANHAGEYNNALKIIQAAKESGADCLKIQTYTASALTIDCDNEYFRINGGLWDGYNLFKLYTEASTPYSWQAGIKAECERIGLDFLSTPFDEDGADFLESLGAQAYKIASFELVHIPLIKHVAKKGKPMIVSCGMGSEEEIGDAVEAMVGEGLSKEQIVLLKCTSEYPAKYENMNLLTIPEMISQYGCHVGFSDHSIGSIAPIAAVVLGACLVEKHLCLSRSIKNPDSGFSMEPQEFTEMVSNVKIAKCLRGKASYELGETESASLVFRRSLFAVADINKGDRITKNNTRIIRPGYGLAPKYIDDILGKYANTDIKRGTPICKEQLSIESSVFNQ